MSIDFSINSVLGSVTIAPKYFFFFYGIGFYVFVLLAPRAKVGTAPGWFFGHSVLYNLPTFLLWGQG